MDLSGRGLRVSENIYESLEKIGFSLRIILVAEQRSGTFPLSTRRPRRTPATRHALRLLPSSSAPGSLAGSSISLPPQFQDEPRFRSRKSNFTKFFPVQLKHMVVGMVIPLRQELAISPKNGCSRFTRKLLADDHAGERLKTGFSVAIRQGQAPKNLDETSHHRITLSEMSAGRGSLFAGHVFPVVYPSTAIPRSAHGHDKLFLKCGPLPGGRMAST